MTAAMVLCASGPLSSPTPPSAISKAARSLGARGGRPKGSLSSPLSKWLRKEIRKCQLADYTCAEAYQILADTEIMVDHKSFRISEATADENGIETIDENGNEIVVTVGRRYWYRIWAELKS